jgi:DNA gyrase subunit B
VEKFIDDVIDHKESDIEKIQTKPNMYISYLGRRGSLHLAKEVINNMIDECINPNSPGNEIDIYLDEVENTLTVADNGRGIPFDKLELVCTKIQAGSKFTRKGSGGSAGENGVGLTAVNALSDYFEIISKRYGEKASIKFEKGKLIQPVTVKKMNSDKHGTTTIFRPNPFYMGEDCAIPTDELITWLDKIIHLVPPEVKITLQVNKKGKEATITKKYRNKHGLLDFVKKLCEKPILSPIHFMDSMHVKEYDKGEELDRFIGLEVAFTYNSSPGEMIVDSFCNFVNTVDNGVHVDAVRQGIVQYLSRQARESLSAREAKKLDIISNDVISGLVLSVYLSTDVNPQFSGQTKEKVTNDLFFKPLRSMTYKALDNYFKKNPKDLKKIVEYIKANAKARLKAAEVRNSVVKGTTTSLEEHTIRGFEPAIAKGKNAYRELLLIEGESAAGTAKQARFNEFQAIYGLKGVPLNTFGLKLDKILQNPEMRNLVRILRCNIGDKFNIDDLWYDKIIIMSDSDVDGYRITSLICAFFLVHMPEIVKQGKLYKAVAPLYKIKDKKRPFVLNKQQYFEVFEERIGDNIRLIDPETGKVMNSEKLKEFLLINREYLDELMRIANHFGVHRQIVEFIVIHSDEEDFKKKLKKRFPELDLDGDVISGIYEGRYQILTIDKLFFKRLKTLKELIHKYNEGKAYYLVHEKNGKSYDDRGVMTIGDFLLLCQKFQPVIETRFKGLGELNPKQLKETTLDPNNRILIQLTIQDLEKELEKFRVLHGDSAEERRQLMEHFKISREDLDN